MDHNLRAARDIDIAESARAISNAFLSARRAATPLLAFPGQLPRSIDDAYAIQSASIAAWPDVVAGWKVGGVPPAFLDQVDTDRIAGPIFAQQVRCASDTPTPMAVFQGGFAAIEPEFVIRTGRTIEPKGLDLLSADICDCIDTVVIGVEVASSPLRLINDLGPMSIISDFGNNSGLVLGAEVANWRERLDEPVAVSTSINGGLVGEVRDARISAAPLEAFRFLIDCCAHRNITLAAGTLVSTGAITGVHQAPVGAVSTARFHELGDVSVEFIAARGA